MKILNTLRKLSIFPTCCLTIFIIAFLAVSLSARAQQAVLPSLVPGDYDSRPLQAPAGLLVTPNARQNDSMRDFKNQVADAALSTNPINGTVNRIHSRTGYLTESSNRSHDSIARDFIMQQANMMGLTTNDASILQMVDSVDKRSGGKNLYYRQICRGIPVSDGLLQVNFGPNRRISAVVNNLIPNLCNPKLTVAPQISAAEAIVSSAKQLSLILNSATPRMSVISAIPDERRTTALELREISPEPITAALTWLQISNGVVGLMWNFQLITNEHHLDIYVSADGQSHDGINLMRNWVKQESYRVFPTPLESPARANPAPPGDGRQLVVNPENALASPNGWIDSGSSNMDGNNVHACADTDANNRCDGNQPVCSGSPLVCSFDLDLSLPPSSSVPAAITNLFYWNNLIHDTQYQYGFTESAGNFQETNFGRGGAGSDSVNADALDGSGNCNANFSTPPDGRNPRMQMFTCNRTSPSRDGDFDAGVIVHEYGHGISIRQVGGPSNSSCLGNTQQAGEGWSDFFALVYTARPGDQGGDERGVGSYLFGRNPNGGTIRGLPYSTDQTVNNWTYESIGNAVVPHGVGSRWAQALWEVYWALVDEHGFNPDLLNPGNFDAGNQRALLYVNEGLQNTACSPTFIDNRDGIIQAAIDNFGGADVCTIWEAFAGFGLGVDASTAGPNSRNATNGFDTPAACQCTPRAVADAGPDVTVCANIPTTIGTAALPGHNYLWQPGGETSAQITVSPAITTTYTLQASTAQCGTASDSVVVTIDESSNCVPVNQPPALNITSPGDGATVQIGTALNFTATATDAEDGDITASINWSSSIDDDIGTGAAISATLSFGNHVVTASVSDSEGLPASDSVSVNIIDTPPLPTNGNIDWSKVSTSSYSNQDTAGSFIIEDGGNTLLLLANTWRKTGNTFDINAATVVEFDFRSTAQGEIHGIGFDENDQLTDAPRIFQIYGDQNWGGSVTNFGNNANGYSGSGDFEPFQINVGAAYSGTMALVLVNDDDAGNGGNNGRFRNVAVRQCNRIDDFEGGADGWSNNTALSTCSTGGFVVGTPTQIVASGVTTQLDGDHSTGTGNAFFTAPNSSAGNADVDGGVCVADSPLIDVTTNSDLSLWYYHGQRDAGDDANGDFFRLEAAVDGGAFIPLVSIGDDRVNAQWRQARLSAQAGQTVQFRVRVADGAATGDLVEAGIDDLMVCPNGS